MMWHTVARVAALFIGVAVAGVAATPTADQAAQTSEQRVAALKQSFADSQARLRKYEWVETTTMSLKGEEKSRKQMRCYYGADGKIQKLPVPGAPAAAPAERGGRRGGRVAQRIVENKKDEMQEYMERAAALVHRYVPPTPADIQKTKDAGGVSVTPVDQGRVRLDLKDYLLPGDTLSVVVNAAANTLGGLSVSSYLDEKDDAVRLDVRFATLADGTTYTAQTTLDVKAKNVRVVVENSGHRPLAQ